MKKDRLRTSFRINSSVNSIAIITKTNLHPVGLILLVLVFLMNLNGTAFGQVPYPGQYLSKLYTEALGRMPDQSGWNGYENYFRQNGCGGFTMRVVGYQFYNSNEFLSLPYDNHAKVLALYRGLLNREPDPDGMNAQVNFLQSGGTWAQVVQSILNSSEFHSTIVPQACGTVIYQDSKHKGIYGWGVGGVIVLPVSDSGTGALGGEYVGQDGNYLQSVIDSAVPGSTILLEQKAVFRLTQPLVLRNLVTLKTVGDPLRFQYANMARLARATNFTGSDTGCGCPPCGEELIRIEPGASLLSVWVDGQRASLSYRGSDINVKILGGIDSTLTTRVANGRISNPAGFSNIQVLGSLEGQRCFGTAVIEENLITSYANDHYFTFLCGGVRRGMFADGVTVSCEKTIVARNDIVDASDVAVVVFSPAADSIQESIVQDNRVLNAGNSAFAAFNTDHIFVDSERDFSGTAFLNNLLWTSDLAHYQIGLSVGSRAWGQAVSGGYGRNATYTGNNTGIKYARGNNAILVAGMRNATVHSNNLSWISVNTSSCPFFVNVVDGTESSPIFNIFTTPNYVNTTVPGGCVAER